MLPSEGNWEEKGILVTNGASEHISTSRCLCWLWLTLTSPLLSCDPTWLWDISTYPPPIYFLSLSWAFWPANYSLHMSPLIVGTGYTHISAPPFFCLTVSMLLTTVLLMYIYTACWLNNYVVQLCPFWCNSYGARLSRLLTLTTFSILLTTHVSL